MSIPRIIIPARAGSKGWPRKNVTLFDHTARIIPKEYREYVTVTTDDESISGLAEEYNFKVHTRPESLAQDSTDIKNTIIETMTANPHKSTELVIMLYLTYPSRTWDDVTEMYNMFVSNGARSMLCRQPVKTHPCLVMYDNKDGTGKQVIPHRHYQRQQYPECFEISHYMCMFRARELPRLNKNMYNSRTIYYNIDRVVDVDSETDYKQYINTRDN